jgi:hypothetical protein
MSESGTQIVVTAAGAQPTPPAALLAQLLALVAATNPGYTANLPGSLIEDISSTDVGALTLIDASAVDTINSLNPFGANLFLLYQLGEKIYGVQQGQSTNTSVYCVFSGSVGFPIAVGFTVSDGLHQYTVQDGGIIGSGGSSAPLFCLATVAGSWAVPASTVTQLITSVPDTISLSVTNPEAGLPGAGTQTEASYRSQVLQAGLAASQGMTRYLKTLLGNVLGVQPRLVSARQITGGGWEIIVGGGDPYEVAYAIFEALFDISTLKGSVISVVGVTRANPGVVTTDLNHGYTTGQTIQIANSNPTNYNGSYTATVLTEKTFSIGTDTTGFPAYVGDAFVTPNSRNLSVTINDYPDVYTIPIVIPPQQSVAISLTWNTTSTNAINPTAVSQLGSQAISDYVNSIAVGVPINLFELQTVFQVAVANLIPTVQLTRMVFSVSINGVGVAPESGTGIIAGDPESYFLTTPDTITITQG